MNEITTQFSVQGQDLSLIRYPAKHQHKSLQAWDSADELLITHCTDEALINDGVCTLIFNDEFGALGCFFARYAPYWISDSWIAHRSLLENLLANDMTPQTVAPDKVSSPVRALTSTEALPEMADVVLIKIPRTLALLEQQLIDLCAAVTPATQVIAAGKVKAITKSVLNLFERYLGPTTTSLAKKKSRLIFCKPDATKLARPPRSPYPTVWPLRAPDGATFSISNLANVFSRQSLDIGARFLLEHLKASPGEQIIDLGCGNGVLGLSALAMAPGARVSFVDESFMAVESARVNVQANLPDALPDCDFITSNCLESLLDSPLKGTVDRVICNPPFHQQNAITDHIAWQMFHDSREMLRKGGHLIVVGNRHLNYHQTLKRLFGGVTQLASHQKFVILSAAKR